MSEPARIYPNYFKTPDGTYTIELVDERGNVLLSRAGLVLDVKQVSLYTGRILAEYLDQAEENK